LSPCVAFAQSTNPIVLENQQPGTTQWQLSQSADDVVKQIKGYASATSVNKGSAITFYVTVTPAQNYTIDIYRLGWYQGLGGRFMQRIGPLSGTPQAPCPVTDIVTGLVECTWIPSNTFTIPATWTTGVYLALLTNSQNYQNYIVFVVRDDSSQSALLYQQSVNTNQAYNNYPDDNATGKSLYDYNSNGANTVVGSKRAAKVSFDRPYADTGDGGFLAYEVYFVQWLESSGYDVSYSTDIDTHASGAQITHHKAFLSVGHNEYWSKPMRTAVEQARDTRVNLGFFGSDAVYWQVRLEPSTANGVPNRVLVCYKDRSFDPVQGPTTTVLWRDPFINLPEQTLVGVMFTAQNLNSYSATPNNYVVMNSSNWVYAGTGLTDGSAVPGIVGYEVDRYFSEYSAPVSVAGTYTLLSHSPVVDVSTNQPSYANSSIYQAPSGAWVFGTGTTDWGWGLARPGFISASIQQVTKNILNRFTGSNPTPVIVGQSPASGATGVSSGTSVSVTFDRAMNASTFSSSTFTLRASGASSNVTASIGVSGATATLTPTSALAAGTTYTVTVAGTVTDTNGNALGSTATWTFTTAASASPIAVQGIVQSVGPGNFGTVLAFPAATTVGNALVCGTVVDGGTLGTITSVTHGPDTFTATPNSPFVGSTPDAHHLYIHTVFSINSASTNVTVNFGDNTASETTVFCQEYKNLSVVDQTPMGSSGTGSTPASQTTGATTAADEVLIAITNSSVSLSDTNGFAVPARCPSPTFCSFNNWWFEAYHERFVTSSGTYQYTSSNPTNWSVLMVTLR
jgi:Bacterial Ig-like domain